MTHLRVAMVGAGFAAGLHAQGWRAVRGIDVELCAVVSSHLDRAETFGREHRVATASTELETVLDDGGIDVVDVCVPNHLHGPVAHAAIAAGKHVVIEKPLTGCFDDPANVSATEMWRRAVSGADGIVEAAAGSGRQLCYAENWLYAPPMEKASRLLAAAGGTILRVQAEESHSGTHSPANHRWATAGGGSLLGKGCHPLAAALYLKAEEGRRRGETITPSAVSATTARLTAAPGVAEGFVRTGYVDVEDWGTMIVSFSDGSVAEITGADTSLGGVRNHLTAYASNALVEANLNPNTAVRAYAPSDTVFAGEYLSEKLETAAGWSYPSPDEHWMQGYPQEFQDFAESVVEDRAPRSDGVLARTVVDVVYAAYVSAAEGRRVELSG